MNCVICGQGILRSDDNRAYSGELTHLMCAFESIPIPFEDLGLVRRTNNFKPFLSNYECFAPDPLKLNQVRAEIERFSR
jgi:hypothetical protein